MLLLVDNVSEYTSFTPKLHALVKERMKDYLGEEVEDKDDCLDFVYHCGDLIGVEVLEP